MPPVGAVVRFTVGPLGLMRTAYDTGFVDQTVEVGDTGVYEGLHPTLLDRGWHLVAVGELVCPCHDLMFEPVGTLTAFPETAAMWNQVRRAADRIETVLDAHYAREIAPRLHGGA